MRGSPAGPASFGKRSASVTIPTSLPVSSTTGTPLIRRSTNSRATSGIGVSGPTV